MFVLFHGTFFGIRFRKVKRLQVQSIFPPDCPPVLSSISNYAQRQNYHFDLRCLCKRKLYKQFQYSWKCYRKNGKFAWSYASNSTYIQSAFLPEKFTAL